MKIKTAVALVLFSLSTFTVADSSTMPDAQKKSGEHSIHQHGGAGGLRSTPMIRHTVAFKLKHSPGSAEEAAFLKSAQVLTTIPTVRNFEWLREVSPKNKFEFGFSMEFASQQDYEAYNTHPEHIRFLETRWKPEVADFLEIDYVPFVPD